jgi:hypothetical protein
MITKGSCLCGKVRFEIEGDFDSFYLCHCSYCRKDTGSAHAANLFTSAARLTWICGRDMVKEFNLATTRHFKSFCSNCGSALPTTIMAADFCMVPAGSLDDKVLIKPDAHLYSDSRANWDENLASIKSYPGLPIP